MSYGKDIAGISIGIQNDSLGCQNSQNMYIFIWPTLIIHLKKKNMNLNIYIELIIGMVSYEKENHRFLPHTEKCIVPLTCVHVISNGSSF